MSVLNKNWKSLIKPDKIIYDGEYSPTKARMIVQPLERGYGLTLGNALRRVALSSLQGAAITAIKIPGVVHEFATKAGMKEDVLDLILNLKNVAIKMFTTEKKIVKLKAKGGCIVTAGMIETTADVEVMNPEQYICTLTHNAELEIELICQTGKGYVPAASNSSEDHAIDIIPIDSIYSPVKKFAYKVEDTRVGQVTDFDKLTIDIETNGSISPEMALGISSRILQNQFQLFVNFEEDEEISVEKQDELQFDPVLLKKVSHLELSVRSMNCLQNDNIVYIGDLVIKTEAEMLKTQNFGRKSLNEIRDILSKYDLKFGMIIEGWPPENVEELAKKYEDKI